MELEFVEENGGACGCNFGATNLKGSLWICDVNDGVYRAVVTAIDNN